VDNHGSEATNFPQVFMGQGGTGWDKLSGEMGLMRSMEVWEFGCVAVLCFKCCRVVDRKGPASGEAGQQVGSDLTPKGSNCE
jgi:hypothetical protein